MVRVIVSARSAYMHRPVGYHPENPGRIPRIVESLRRSSIDYEWLESSVLNTREALEIATRIHSRSYVGKILEMAGRAPLNIDEDTYISKDSVELALETLGESYRLALQQGNGVVFYIARPPGHHAGVRGRATGARTQGFCIFNNAVAAVKGFMDRGLGKVAVLDFDAHYGNGSMEILYGARVLQVDLHQDTRTIPVFPLLPGSVGSGEGYGFKVGIPLEPGTGDDSYVEVLEAVWRVIERYNPEAFVVSAGFDGFRGDGLTDLVLTEYTFHRLGEMIRGLGVPTVVVLEGGYSSGLDKGVAAFIKGLKGVAAGYKPARTVHRVVRRVNLERAISIISWVEKHVY
ncbi:histone deacetylase [Desulfurococcus mucosus]|uniref:Histone deacetylase superfamily n=1 Tax=Desulfurococcus mucosus (strain ATCC 35584 / DSM 2162 / JCM 9187 / O7/1) TaxID=765177 RepID=E8R705_DESM0|nr:histone deacetylase [Desulfurococcus mucosus]ADV64438.1 histone deacetylase superfamily [Desulfurococcus mucosus DSM 2162]